MAINSYAEFQAYLTGILTTNKGPSGSSEEADATKNAPHSNFWNTLTYDQFTTGPVPNVNDPNTGDPMPIMEKNNADNSNIIMALRGTPGSLFDPNNPNGFGRMPADGGPFLTDDQIQPIADWINAGAPNGGTEVGDGNGEEGSKGGEDGASY